MSEPTTPPPPAPAGPKRRRRALRWLVRGVLGLLALVVTLAAVALIVLHTDWGRERARRIAEAKLAEVFTGGATIGKLEGSPFGELVARDLVIFGPEGTAAPPVFAAKTVRLHVALLPLIRKQARLASLEIEDLDARLERDANGELEVARLLRPAPKSGWSIELEDVHVARAHVKYDTGREVMNLDEVDVRASADLPFEEPLRASLDVAGRWRERAVPITVAAALTSVPGALAVERAHVRAGTVAASVERFSLTLSRGRPEKPDVGEDGRGETMTRGRPEKPDVGEDGRGETMTEPDLAVAGTVTIDAPRAELARLVPGLELPADVQVKVEAEPIAGTPWTRLAITGALDREPVTARLQADLRARRAIGFVATGALDATALSRGAVDGRGSAFVSFDLAMPPGAELPEGHAMLHAWGTFEGIPDAGLRVAIELTGGRANVIADVNAPHGRARATADVAIRDRAVTLHRGTLVASTDDPQRTTGGAAPVRGAIHAALTASGALAPAPSLAVTGTVKGRRLRVRDLYIDSLELAIDAKRLPHRPLGRAELVANGVDRGDMHLAELAVTAADRADGKLAVAVRTRPRQNPWLIEADALVTPGAVVAVELVRHRVRAGGGTEWRGDTGRLTIGPERIELRDLASTSPGGAIRVAGSYLKAGPRTGDADARVDVTTFSLGNLASGYRGTVDAHVELARRGARLTGRTTVTAKGVALDPRAPIVDGEIRADLRDGALAATATVTAPGHGRATVALDLAAPRDAANPAAWRALDRRAIRTATVTLADLDVGRIAALAEVPGPYRGLVDAEVRLAGGTVGGRAIVRDLVTPGTRTLGPIAADLELGQTPAGELRPTLAARFDGVTGIRAQATIATPDRLLDPAAWRRLGRDAIRQATVRAEDIAFDPGLLDRFGVITDLRGRASLIAEVGEGARAAQLGVRVIELRGGPIARPIEVGATIGLDGAGATYQALVTSAGVRLVEARGRARVGLAMLEADPRAARTAPIAATITIPTLAARQVGTLFGRSEIQSGTITGAIDVAGTVGRPTARARLEVLGLALPPGPRGRPVKRLERLALDARWDGTAGALVLDGTQPGGSLRVTAKGSPTALGAAVITLQAKQFDLAPVLVLAPGAPGAAAGRLDANLTVAGLDPKTAKIAGELHLAEARLPLAPSIGTLRRAKIDVVAGDHQLELVLDGRLGGGTVKATGTIAVTGAAPTGGDVTVALRGVSPIGAVEPRISADITAKLQKAPDRWIANVAIRNGSVVVPRERGEPLKPVGAPPDMVFLTGDRITQRPRKAEPPSRPTIEARVLIGPTQLESEELRGVISGRLTITADADSVGVVGGIEAERGDLELFGRRYLVERAAARFDGSTDPRLDVRISHDFPEVTTITEVHGRLSQPQLAMSADPGTYSQGQLLGFLLGGEPNGQPAAGNPRDQATSAGASFVANRIGGYVRRALPIDVDVLRYEAATASTSAAVTVGTWLTRELFLAYRRRLEARPDENTGEAEAEYWLTRRVMVEGVLGDRGISGVDLLWRRRY